MNKLPEVEETSIETGYNVWPICGCPPPPSSPGALLGLLKRAPSRLGPKSI